MQHGKESRKDNMFTIETIPSLSKIEYTSFVFSGGEVQPRITNPNQILDAGKIRITAFLTNSEKFFELSLLVDAIRRINHKISIYLVCPYFPYARQDRSMVSGESLGAKVSANFLNTLKFDSVEVWDAHSDVSLALIENVTNIGPEDFLGELLAGNQKDYVLVSPDAGAMKKVDKVAKRFGLTTLSGIKHRDPATGNITGTSIQIPPEHYRKTFLIVDDICDGGRTFTELAKAIDFEVNAFSNSDFTPKIELYVTHGIFSKGLDVLADAGIWQIYTPNPFPNVDLSHPNLTVISKG
jgi:ribose-phosphate pyrophosphokinase